MGDTRFYVKVSQMEEENALLREEIVKLDDKSLLLERINACLKRQLKEDHKKYDELQQEYDKLNVALYEVMEKERISKGALKECKTEKMILMKKLEAAELEAQEMANLKEKLKKAMNERSESTKKVVEMIKTLEEEHTKCEFLQTIVKELEETNENLQKICESRDNTIQVLRETSRELADENAELKLLISTNVRFLVDQGSTTPNSDTESFYMHCTSSCESNDVVNHDSLYDELKASGFMNTSEKDDTINRQLEDQVHWYELEINALLKQTESAFEQLVSIYGEERFRLCVTKNLDNAECSEQTQNFEMLKQRIQILLDTFITTPSKISDIGTQLRANSEARENLHDALNFRNNSQHDSLSPVTNNPNSHGETVPIQSDILHEDEKLLLQMDAAIIQGSSQRLNMGRKNPKRTNEAVSERDLTRHDNVEFTDANVRSPGAMSLGYRRSKSESSLITEKKLTPYLHHSFNVFTMPSSPEKTNETVETREKIITGSTSKERECKNIEERKEQNGAQNLMSWHEYQFGGTYRSLNDSTDSSISSTPSRHDNSLLGSGDFSLIEPCQQQQQHREFYPVYLAPTRLKRSSNKTTSFPEENGVNGTDMGCQRIDSNNGLIRSTIDRYDRRSMSSSQRFSNSYIYESFTANSTPIHTDSKDKSFCMYKKDIRQSSSKSKRRSSCGSLIRHFVDLDISNDGNDSLSMHDEYNSDKVNCNEHVQRIYSTDTPNVASVSTESLSSRCNMLKRSSHVFRKHEDPNECSISEEMQFFIATVKETVDCIDTIQESIHETSLNYENDANGFEKSVHENLPHVEKLQDYFENVKTSLEENNNILQGNDFYTTSSNNFLNDVSQNFEEKLTDSSKVDIVGSEQKLRTTASLAPAKNMFIMPSWRMFISYALVFVVGYYLKDIIPLRTTCAGAPCTWYSLEEIINRYFPIGSRKLRPL